MYYILIAIFLWSSLGIVIRFSGVPIHLLIFYSSVISSLLTGILFLKKQYRKEFPELKSMVYFLILGPLGLINTFSFFYAYKHTSIANAVLTHYTAPIFVAFLAQMFLKERLTWKILLAVAVATAGLWVMLDVSLKQFIDLLMAGDRNTGGIIAGLLSGLAYAVLVIIMRVMSQSFHPLVMTFSQNFIVSLILLPFAGISENYIPVIWAFAVMGIVHSTIAPVLYFRGLREVTANRAAILGYLEPVCAIILGVLFLSEPVSYKIILGGSMILFSGYLTVKNSD